MNNQLRVVKQEKQNKLRVELEQMDSEVERIVTLLSSMKNENNRQGMKRFGIEISTAFGISVPVIRSIAKQYVPNQVLAEKLWNTAYHEARLMAVFLAEPKKIEQSVADVWTDTFNSWDICDQTCGNVFIKTPFWKELIKKYAKDDREFVRRTSFAMIATAAVHLKKEDDALFIDYFPLIAAYSSDDRNFVRKAVNWALRSIGKRNRFCGELAIEFSLKLKENENKTAKWIGADAYRELVGRYI